MKKLKDTFGRAPAEAALIIDELGGNTGLASSLGVTPQALSYWRRKGIPVVWIHMLRMKHRAVFVAAKDKAAANQPPAPDKQGTDHAPAHGI